MKLFLKSNLKKVKITVTFLAILCITNVHAQEIFNISGKVTDAGKPFSGVNVLIKGTSKGTLTNADGDYSISLKQGIYSIVFSTFGKPKEFHIVLNKNLTLNVDLADTYLDLEEVLVAAVRVKSTSPVTHSNVKKEDIETRNLGQDIPILLNYLPSVVTTSDAGAGVGYTGIRVRGSDATRVNVTINGIPYNDAESQGTYWVDLPDFASSTESIQLQRGVGTSTNGSGAFGASLNLLTDAVSENAYGEISSSVGSYNTFKNTIKFSTGKINDHFEFAGRLSKINSDGYIDNAWSNLKSYFLQAAYTDDNTLIKAITFSGKEKTYQAWAGVSKEDIANFGRTYNPYTYENEIDNYQQDHYQFHWNEKINNYWSTNIALNYTKGKGYFEQFKEAESFSDYNLTPIEIGGEIIEETDLIRRRWLDNDYYVANANATYNNNNLELIIGTSYSNYQGIHFGEIIWAEYAGDSNIRDRYYESNTKKTDTNIFAKLSYKLDDFWTVFSDVQARFVGFKTNGLTSDRAPINVDETYNFINPKAGISFRTNEKNSIYFSYANASKEPNRNDFENGVNTSEELHDFELGWRFNSAKSSINTNFYYMLYQNQLVLTGAIDDTGAFIRATSGKSYRFGLEIDAQLQLSKKVTVLPNIALSTNKNKNFVTSKDGALVNLGTTNISFSPEIVAGNAFIYNNEKGFEVAFLSKFVGEQFMGNIDAENSKLDSYFVNDFNLSYTFSTSKLFSNIRFSLLVNNILNTRYISNGYYYTYDDTWSVPGETTTLDGAGYYPQATRNFLVGITLSI